VDILSRRGVQATIDVVSEPEPVIYREEVTAILGVLADILVEVRDIAGQLRGDDGGEEEED
jgi:hypothetical protein